MRTKSNPKRESDAKYKLASQLQKHEVLRSSFLLLLQTECLPVQCRGLAWELHPLQVQLGELHGHQRGGL